MHSLPILLSWLCTDALATYSVFHHRRAFTPPSPASEAPATALVVAIKGIHAVTPLFLEALRQQDYPHLRLIFAIESLSDPVAAMLTQWQALMAGHRHVDIITAGPSSRRAQKIHNLLAALATLRAEDRVVVFADADIVPGPMWISDLVRPVARHETAASCGYRWQVPTRLDLPSMIVAIADMSVATIARSRRWNLCWAGSVALDRAALDQIDLPSVWDRAASDDLILTQALRAQRLRIYVPPHVLVPSPIALGWHSLFQFMHRQYLLVRVYAPLHWWVAAWTLVIPAAGLATAVVLLAQARYWTLGFIGVSALLLQLRLQLRLSIADIVLTDDDRRCTQRAVTFARWAWPLIHAVHLAAFLGSAFGRRFRWAGIRYRLVGRQVEVS